MLGYLTGRKAPEPDEALAQIKARIQGTDIEKWLRAGGEAGVGPGPGLPDEYLFRWLRAEVYNVSKAFDRLEFQAKWRKDYCPEGYIREEDVRSELNENKVALLDKNDSNGRPIMIVFPSRHFRRKDRDLAVVKRSQTYWMDILTHVAEANGGDGRVNILFDMRGSTMENVDLPVSKQIVLTVTTHYPERLGQSFIICPPTIIMAVWRALYYLIPEATRERIQFLSDENAARQNPYLKTFLPESLGGDVKFKSFEEAAAKVGYGTAAHPNAGPRKVPVDDDPDVDFDDGDDTFWDAETGKLPDEQDVHADCTLPTA
eukprot:jgi/Botrbrau1/17582/Bobra.0166s0024.1